jgi:hypothetical protein
MGFGYLNYPWEQNNKINGLTIRALESGLKAIQKEGAKMGRKNKVLFVLEPREVKIRNTWKINPVTKIVPSKTKYNRKKRHKGMAIVFTELYGAEKDEI